MDRINDVISGLETAKGTYMPPMLTAQISYLFDMVNAADQIPGQEAENRFRELQQRFAVLAASASDF